MSPPLHLSGWLRAFDPRWIQGAQTYLPFLPLPGSVVATLLGPPPSSGLPLSSWLRRLCELQPPHEQICIRFLFASSRDIANGKRVYDGGRVFREMALGTRIHMYVRVSSAYVCFLTVRSTRSTMVDRGGHVHIYS